MAPRAPLPEGTLTERELNRATLARQGLLSPIRHGDPAAAVRQVGSLQAQHPEWPPIALAARAGDHASADLAGALERRGVVRASLMRITIHIVSADDYWPMFAVCQALRLDQWRLLTKSHPTDSPLGRRMSASHEVALAALADKPRSSLELDRLMAAELGTHMPEVTRAAWRHLATFVPLVHVPHATEGYGRSLYATAEAWLGVRPPAVDLDEARRQLTRRYLAAFGPASVADLAAYVGRGRGGIGAWRNAIQELGDEVIGVRDDAGRMLFDLRDAPRPPADAPASPRLLARWDSLLLSHESKHRGRVIAAEHRPAVYSRNADVLPTFLVDGFVAGTWNLVQTDGMARIDLRPFAPLAHADRATVSDEAERLLERIAADAADRSVSVQS